METLAGVAVWLEPSADDAAPLSAEIARLAEICGSPVFPPHITVAAEFERDDAEVAEVIAGVAAARPVSKVHLVAAVLEDVVWRSLYLTAEPSGLLQAVRDAVCTPLGLDSGGYRPHLSLLYSDLPHDRRERLRRAGLGVTLPREITVDRLSLWRLDGPVEAWHRVATAPLAERRRPWVAAH